MKNLLAFAPIFLILFGFSGQPDLAVLNAEIIAFNDTTQNVTRKVLQLQLAINPGEVTRFAIVKKRDETVVAQFNVVEQEDGFYYEGMQSYRKIYDERIRLRVPINDGSSIKNYQCIYFINSQKKKIKL